MSKETHNKRIVDAKDIPFHIKKKLFKSKRELEERQKYNFFINPLDYVYLIAETKFKKNNSIIDNLLDVIIKKRS